MLVMNRDSWDGLDADTQAKLAAMTGAGDVTGWPCHHVDFWRKGPEKWAAEGAR